MPREPFRFRQFSVRHERCGQPVCTDSILLGAWATVEHAIRAVDIGTGCGLLALMLAQRQPRLNIEAIEIDAGAVEEARDNFASSPWADRLAVSHLSMDAYGQRLTSGRGLDLVICNPPWIPGGDEDAGPRIVARHAAALSPRSVIRFAPKSLAAEGLLAMLLPTAVVKGAVEDAAEVGLGLRRWTRVVARAGVPSRRSLVEFGRLPCGNPVDEALVLTSPDGSASPEFRNLAGDFYLAFPVEPLCLPQNVAADNMLPTGFGDRG